MDEQEQAFFVVWSPSGGAPTVRHPTLIEAHDEAMRLAGKRDSKFYVLMMVGYALREEQPVRYQPVRSGILNFSRDYVTFEG